MNVNRTLRMHAKQIVQHAAKDAAQEVGRLTKSDVYRWTQYFVFGLSIFFVICDIVLPLLGYTRFSELLREWAFGKGFVLAWIWGVLGGHLFIVRAKNARILDEVMAISILVILSLIFLCVACFYDKDGHTVLNLILLALGCAAGHFLWPQLPPDPKP
jgi:hypothetical protein